jgi:hypothetical protein
MLRAILDGNPTLIFLFMPGKASLFLSETQPMPECLWVDARVSCHIRCRNCSTVHFRASCFTLHDDDEDELDHDAASLGGDAAPPS